jgi:ribA/ribD-fused uncharacterized protein
MIYSIDWLKEKFKNGEQIKYVFFWGHTGEGVGSFIFSQWFPSPFVVDGITYKTCEHWMMAQKATLFQDKEIFNKIIQAKKPGEVKELGRQIKNFDQSKWDETKYEIVKKGNICKFQQNQIFEEYLLGTGDRVLVESSPVDTIWGVGLTKDARSIEDPNQWRGQNLLGFALMEVRDFLRNKN